MTDNLHPVITRSFENFVRSNGELRAHGLIAGPTGSGKTRTVTQLSLKYDLPTITVDCVTLTKEGHSGASLSKLLSPLAYFNEGQTKVVVFDEFDKLFLSGNHFEAPAVATTGVQMELLTLLGSNQATIAGEYGKFKTFDTSKCLFVFAGAFNGVEVSERHLIEMNVKTELIGRLSYICNLKAHSLEELISMMKNSKLLDTYLKFKAQNIETVLPKLLESLQQKFSSNIFGARIVEKIIHQHFLNEDEPIQSYTKVSSWS